MAASANISFQGSAIDIDDEIRRMSKKAGNRFFRF
jgi:hypothetical protein